jgi:hypothetical protein
LMNWFNGLSLPLSKTQVTDLGTPNTELVTIPSGCSTCLEFSGSTPQPWTLGLLWGSLCVFHMVCPSGYWHFNVFYFPFPLFAPIFPPIYTIP